MSLITNLTRMWLTRSVKPFSFKNEYDEIRRLKAKAQASGSDHGILPAKRIFPHFHLALFKPAGSPLFFHDQR